MNPSAAITDCAGRLTVPVLLVISTHSIVCPPRIFDTSASVITSTEEAFSSSTLCAWARNADLRWTSVTDEAIGSRLNAQSHALSPPPTTITS